MEKITKIEIDTINGIYTIYGINNNVIQSEDIGELNHNIGPEGLLEKINEEIKEHISFTAEKMLWDTF